MQLSEAGLALLPRAKRILQEVYDTQRFMADLRGDVSGHLRIGTSHHIGLHRLPRIEALYNIPGGFIKTTLY